MARKTYSVHRLVYTLFVDEIPEGLEINHIDGDKENNCIQNLEVCDRAYNVQHAWDNKLMKHSKSGIERIRQASIIGVRCIQTGEEFGSMTEAAKAYDISKSGISAQIKGRQKTAGKHKITKEGLTWELI